MVAEAVFAAWRVVAAVDVCHHAGEFSEHAVNAALGFFNGADDVGINEFEAESGR